MKIAVTYENGQIFQHFGRTEQFKVYEIEDGAVVSAEVIGTDGFGHGALADYLAEKGVCALICGGMGMGARIALDNADIEVYAGVFGDADAAVAALLTGQLDAGNEPNCGCGGHHDHGHHHHHDHEHGEGCGCGGHHHEHEHHHHHEHDHECSCGHDHHHHEHHHEHDHECECGHDHHEHEHHHEHGEGCGCGCHH